MRIPSGTTDQYIYFVAVDSTDFATRETGLSSFTVYRSRNGAAAAAMTTPTINETDSSNMPGVYELLLDEDMTIGTGNYSEEMVFHITHAGMAPVTRTIELYLDPLLEDRAQPSQGAPAATATVLEKVDDLHMSWRNKKDADSSFVRVYADDGSTVICKAPLTDDDTTTTRGEMETGP